MCAERNVSLRMEDGISIHLETVQAEAQVDLKRRGTFNTVSLVELQRIFLPVCSNRRAEAQLRDL